MKKDYSAPALTVFGNATALTQGHANGNYTDKIFPINTPKKDLTFSN
jgi:hypothetical protein